MCTHLDTVPPFIPPTSDGSVVKGRGANDAKGAQLAAMIFAARRIAKEEPNLADDLGLLFLVGEEVDHIGMIAANNLKLKPEYLVIGEPTQLKFGRMQKGSLKKAILNVEGKAAHSGYPELGESAVEKLLEILQDIRNYKWSESKELRKTTLNIDIDIISGGQALNALAAKASAKPFFRVTTSTADISKRLKDIVSNRVQIDFSLGKNEPVHLNESPIDVDSCVISFNTDLSYFNNKDLLKGGYLFAAGDIRNAHSDNEFIRIAVLHLAVETHINLFRRLISESPANDDIARD
uniref:M20_dimer domain-containing protein n=1 Tax=Syphacia muris TaxID=451379 RepID=A0A0N5AVC7_9BILA